MKTICKDQILGALWGAAVGDALGVPVEFSSRAAREADPVKGMRGHGTWNQPKGTWSDDTSMSLCLTESLINAGFDLEEQGILYSEWKYERKWTPRGRVFDIGGTCGMGIARFMEGMRPSGLSGESANGNGSLMRTLPLSIWLAYRDVNVVETYQLAGDASAITHAHPRSRLGCALHALFVRHIIDGDDPHLAHAKLSMARSDLMGLPDLNKELSHYGDALDPLLAGMDSPGCAGSGYVVDCFQAALWSVLSSSSFSEAVLKAVNLGDDADTTGCVAGGLAGLVFGMKDIPQKWRDTLARSYDMACLFTRFMEGAL